MSKIPLLNRTPDTSARAARDAWARAAWLRALKRTASIESNPFVTLPSLIEPLAAAHGSAVALAAPEESLTYVELARRCNQYARWGMVQGLKPGDTVCLLMANCAEYLAVWLGLTRLGVVVALVNSHLSGDVLAHAIRIVRPKLIIAGASLAPALAGTRASLPAGLSYRVRGTSAVDMAPIDTELMRQSGEPLTEAQCPAASIDAPALYLYTSGTTGLPKAARVSHYRLMQWSHWFAGMMDTNPHDRMFNCLPLYHSIGGVVATGATLIAGGAVVIRARFSASDFWRDVRDERCTLFQYIGELCSYLVAAPPHCADREHSLRLACGNGLRPEVWEAFQARFGIPRILEYYAATEANFSLYNCEGEPGAIGRIPPYLGHRVPVALLRFDVDSGEPRRNAAGFCERCDPDEAGEAVGLIPALPGERAGRFEGYTDAEDSGRKVLVNVFRPGDAWYRTGDLMRRDRRGFYYFVERLGDTFRWKGENVSCAEVLAVLTALPGVLDGAVYGVPVPGAEGRAGMAALIVAPQFDLRTFGDGLAERLPAYARPLFLRLVSRLESTTTFRPIKHDLVRAGFDPAQVNDPLFVSSRTAGAFVPLDRALHAAIVAGTVKL